MSAALSTANKKGDRRVRRSPFLLVPLRRFELRPTAPEAGTLSIEL